MRENAALRSLLEREIGIRRFEDPQLPLFVVATDISDGAEVVLAPRTSAPASPG